MDFRSFLTLCSCLFFLGQHHLSAQLSGIVNTYVKVTAVDYGCNKVTVTSPTGFAVNDKVLLIQMQGATIDQTNSANFGNITAIGDAGNYEFAYIDHFVGNDVYFKQTLLKTYTPSGSVQMVSVPQYTDASVDGELTASAWDGNTGGIIVLECSGTLTLNANINANEKGFRGGHKSATGGDCVWPGQNNYYFTYPTVDGGQKGEGINGYILGEDAGRGKNSTGGGGGNNHNTGGGGGGNFGAGGRGGDKKNTGCSFAANPYGLGAMGLSTTYYTNSTNRVFLGGGGGGGQQNNALSFDAGNGGGLIILKAARLNANGYSIQSNGGSVNSYYILGNINTDNGDGNSAGGAGGTVLLDVQNYSTTTTVTTVGGRGGDTGYTHYDFGPGGGGGGGVIWTAGNPVSLSTNVVGGNSGISGSGGGNGSGTSWNATNGSVGAVLNNLITPLSTTTSSCILLPVELLSFNAKYTGRYTIGLSWATVKEENNAFFTIEKSSDGIHYTLLSKTAGNGSSSSLNEYKYTDEVTSPTIFYYKLLQTDIDGTTSSLGIRVAYPEKNTRLETIAYPNPFNEVLNLHVFDKEIDPIQQAYFLNNVGETFWISYSQDDENISFDTASIPAGMYTLVLQHRESIEYIKVVKK